MVWLAVLLVINAAISAAYYLRIVMAMFSRPEPAPLPASTVAGAREVPVSIGRPWPVIAGIYLSVLGTLVLGISLPTTSRLSDRAMMAQIDQPPRVQHKKRKAPVAAQAEVDFDVSGLDR
jgi:NADH:ubiquinone oxidoreductase subunit 2 (subunit N)